MDKIFVVEDSKSQAALLQHILTRSGYEVDVYHNGKLALDAMRAANVPDMILSDIDMPEMDGLSLCQIVKDDPVLRDIPFVLITASDKIDELVASLNALADGFMIKPYNHNVLIETIAFLLKKKAAGTLVKFRPSEPVSVTVGHKHFSLNAGREHLFEFFMIAFNNASVQARELDARERKLKETNTELARNIELLAASEERFRSLVEAVPDIVYKLNADGTFTFINDSILHLGYEPSELIGKHFSAILYPEDAPSCDADVVLPYMASGTAAESPKLFNERRSKDRMTVGLRIRLMTKEREEILGELRALGTTTVHVEINSMGMYGVDSRSNRKYVGTVGVIRDITERIRFEKELEEARDSANAANRAKSDFLSSMSHELRTPLNAILGFAQLLDIPENPLNGEQREMVKHVVAGGEHLLRLIGDVLDLSKIESGHEHMEIGPINDVTKMVDSALKMVATLAVSRNIAMKNNVPTNLPSIMADRTRIRQVLINLLSNAIKYNRDHGSVTISSELRDGFVRLSVVDTGRGIPESKLGLLFQPFQRLGVDANRVDGTGIGLVITKQLVEKMGGQVGVESRVEDGSTFWIEIPVADESHTVHPETPEQDVAFKTDALRDIRVLYVEDNPTNSLLMQSMLKRHTNITLDITTNAEDGIAFARQHQPDVILMDLRLPGMSGIEAALLLRTDVMTCHIPIIAVTAEALAEVIRQANSAGFFAYLTKPFNGRELLRQINKAAGLITVG